MNLGDMLRQSGALDAIARDLGTDQKTAQAGAAALLPAILAGMGRSGAGSGGLGGLIGGLAGAGGGGLLDLVLGGQPTPAGRGNDILGQIFGNKDVSRSVATEAAAASGLDPALLKRMLPLLAMAVTGYLAQRGQAGSAANPTPSAAQPGLGGLLGTIIGGFARR